MYMRHRLLAAFATVGLGCISIPGCGDEPGPGANLEDRDLRGADLHGVDLSFANLSRAQLADANLSLANLSHAKLYAADLSRANLRGANLSKAMVTNADLTAADLAKANLTGAFLVIDEAPDRWPRSRVGVDLSRANLSGANLTRADLSGANLRGANLNGSIWLETICPQGGFTSIGLDDCERAGMARTEKLAAEAAKSEQIKKMAAQSEADTKERKALCMTDCTGPMRHCVERFPASSARNCVGIPTTEDCAIRCR